MIMVHMGEEVSVLPVRRRGRGNSVLRVHTQGKGVLSVLGVGRRNCQC